MKIDEIRKSFNESVEIIKKHSESFYKAFKKLPEKKFLAVASIYAFCRTADDLADEMERHPFGEHLSGLHRLKENILSLEKNEEVKNEYVWWAAFELTVKEYDISCSYFLMQIEGQKSDMEFEDVLTLEDLIRYSRNVAGSVGLMMLPILTSDPIRRKDLELQKACENLGVAMQITNILRDVGEDLKLRDRMYIPRDLLNKYGLSAEKIRDLLKDPFDNKNFNSFRMLWEELAKISEAAYDNFKENLCKLDHDSRLPVYAASLVYKAILDEVRGSNYDCLTKKNFTSHGTKIKLLGEALLYTKKLCKE